MFCVSSSLTLPVGHIPSPSILISTKCWCDTVRWSSRHTHTITLTSHSNVRFLLIYLFFLFRFDSIPLFVFASCVSVCAIHEPSVYTVYRMLGETVWVFVRIRIYDWATNDDVELAKFRIQHWQRVHIRRPSAWPYNMCKYFQDRTSITPNSYVFF